jgi:hypothetical protein
LRGVINLVLRFLFCLPAIVVLMALLWVNVKVYDAPETAVAGRDTIHVDLLKELRGLKAALNNGADIKMQQLYPEGYVFVNATYGLAWCNFMGRLNGESEYFKEGAAEIQAVWNKLDSDLARSSFPESLPLRYGSFYSGWSTYFLGRKLFLESPVERHEAEVAHFKQKCDSIAASIQENIYPVSYYGGAWPADVMMCVAALSWHDKLFEPKYGETRKVWLDKVKEHLDDRGLIPHAASPLNGKAVENARGSSLGLMLVFLREIDASFAAEQFSIYRSNFLDRTLGLTGIREYPKGEFGIGDVDSGPVLFQMGSAATLVGMQTLYVYGDVESSFQMRNVIDAIAFPLERNDRKTYLFGLLPMADAFIAWSHSVEHGLDRSTPSFITFHVISAAVCIALGALLWIILKPKRPTSHVLHIPW